MRQLAQILEGRKLLEGIILLGLYSLRANGNFGIFPNIGKQTPNNIVKVVYGKCRRRLTVFTSIKTREKLSESKPSTTFWWRYARRVG
jgi:hypothetical protein